MMQQNDDRPIYHYTSVAGLLGMLENCKKEQTHKYLNKRATHSYYLNDPEEFKYGAQFLDTILVDVEKILNIPNDERIAGCVDLPKVHKIQGSLEGTLGTPYISSFTYASENLPMWGMYADNGKGVMMQFDKNIIEDSGIVGVTCTYVNADDDISDNIDVYTYTYKKLKEKYAQEVDAGVIDKHQAQLLFYLNLKSILSPSIKHTAYKYEDEYRLALASNGNINFMEKGGMIIPYIDVNIPIEALQKVYIGPNAQVELLKNSLSLLFQSKGIKVDIEESSISYRG